MRYKHTQIGWWTILFVGGLVFVLACLAAHIKWSRAVPGTVFFGPVCVVLIGCLILFGSLTVTVDDTAVTVQFGLGPFRKSIPLRDIAYCRQVRNPWWWGWGIKRVPGGWMYSVSGLDSVEIVTKDGRMFRIGTDEPKVLAEFIEAKLKGVV
ncbi:MAG: PH domain-containing protein [Verrucomicrobiae bacterium]|nr:PH domain-containing protein [Verrucomicrobiae bacterium]MCX7722064.1 PH domain-containing protein [Verrucomicrobiae bacterium]MDW7979531.1 hypothetical protein [Verrucomicrobiales bacterium]